MSVPAVTVNDVCGSGLKAVELAAQSVLLGRARAVLAGGTENMADAMSLSLVRASGPASGKSDSSLASEGLRDPFSGDAMGVTAERVARLAGVSRERQDAYALRSQRRAARAVTAGRFADEIVPVVLPDGRRVSADETPRPGSTLHGLGALEPAFMPGGSVTAGNSSPISSGAAAVVVASGRCAQEAGVKPLAAIIDTAEVGVDPGIMGLAPRDAIRLLLRRNGLRVNEVSRYELNEAFAATTVAVIDALGLPSDRVNVNGGAIALGHPLAASGARILTTLIDELRRVRGRYGVAALCIGGGMGLAMLVENPDGVTDGSGVAAAGGSEEDQSGSRLVARRFRDLSERERRERLVSAGRLTRKQAGVFVLGGGGWNPRLGLMIENGIGEMAIPVGVVPGLLVNGRSYDVPLATEEPSVVAAASNGAKIVRLAGGFQAHTRGRAMIGQALIANPRGPRLAASIASRAEELRACANAAHPAIVRRGGGARSVRVREIRDGGSSAFLSVDVIIDVRDAMGANIVDTMMEAVTGRLRAWFPGEQVLMGILSNYATESLTEVRCTIPFGQVGQEVAESIVLASQAAQADPFRAATHNKGIMNGVEAATLATGNDTRAIAAACHAYAARDGAYRGLGSWHIEPAGKGVLAGMMTLPMPVATVGGACSALPSARAGLALTGVRSAAELGRVIAALGLAQNLAALKALVTEGIQRGHMALQARTLAVAAGATGAEIDAVASRLVAQGSAHMSPEIARAALGEFRGR